ncbi:MAG: hypothetical protein ABR875_00965 [Minisyncoccia bacterium]|jgi:hypothetical protein
MEIKAMIRSHFVAIILAVIVGVISVAPQIFVLKDQNYRGIQMFGADAEYDYVAKMNQSMYGDYSKGPFPPDPGKNYYLAPEFTERAMGFMAQVFHIRVTEMNVIFKFICPIFIFLILYGWLLEMFSSRAIALIAPLFVMLGTNLLDSGEFLRLIHLKTSIDTFLPYTRPMSPQVSSLFLFTGLWSIYRLVNRQLRFRTALLIGILCGFSLYAYVFSWTMLTALTGLYLLYFILRKEIPKAKQFLLVLIANGIVSLPFFLNMLRARSDIDYIDTTARIGLIHTHMPILGILIVIGFAILILLWPKKHGGTKCFLLFCLTALLLVINQQIITGTQLQPGHYHWYITKPLIAIILTLLGLYWVDRLVSGKKLRIAVYIFTGSLLILSGVVIQTHSYAVNYPQFQENQRYAPLFDFLSGHYPRGRIIWTDQNLSTLILAYTGDSAPDNLYATQYTDSQKHLRDMLFLEYRLKGVNPKDIFSIMLGDRTYVTMRLFGLYYRDLPGNHELSDEALKNLAQEYNDSYALPLEKIFKNLGIDLAVEDKKDHDLGLSTLSFLSKISLGDGLNVYEFKNK